MSNINMKIIYQFQIFIPSNTTILKKDKILKIQKQVRDICDNVY